MRPDETNRSKHTPPPPPQSLPAAASRDKHRRRPRPGKRADPQHETATTSRPAHRRGKARRKGWGRCGTGGKHERGDRRDEKTAATRGRGANRNGKASKNENAHPRRWNSDPHGTKQDDRSRQPHIPRRRKRTPQDGQANRHARRADTNRPALRQAKRGEGRGERKTATTDGSQPQTRGTPRPRTASKQRHEDDRRTRTEQASPTPTPGQATQADRTNARKRRTGTTPAHPPPGGRGDNMRQANKREHATRGRAKEKKSPEPSTRPAGLK